MEFKGKNLQNVHARSTLYGIQGAMKSIEHKKTKGTFKTHEMLLEKFHMLNFPFDINVIQKNIDLVHLCP